METSRSTVVTASGRIYNQGACGLQGSQNDWLFAASWPPWFTGAVWQWAQLLMWPSDPAPVKHGGITYTELVVNFCVTTGVVPPSGLHDKVPLTSEKALDIPQTLRQASHWHRRASLAPEANVTKTVLRPVLQLAHSNQSLRRPQTGSPRLSTRASKMPMMLCQRVSAPDSPGG